MKYKTFLALLFTFWTAVSSSRAQTARAALTGTVLNQNGLPLADATVEVQQRETHWARKTQTGAAGNYSIRELAIGTYSVAVSRSGFTPSSPTEIKLLVGQERTLNFKLTVAGRSEQVNVTSSLGEIDQTSAVIQGRMVERQIEGLPINGRNWSNLLPLVPGATDAGTSDQRTVRFAGHGRDDNNISFDGVDATGISN